MSRGFPIAVPVILLLILASTCVFTVSENELAIRTQFREIVQADYEPGLHFKTPIDSVLTPAGSRRLMARMRRPSCPGLVPRPPGSGWVQRSCRFPRGARR